MIYPSKILLFGEYSVVLGGKALAIPYPRFSGHWQFGESASAKNSNQALRKLAEYISSQPTLAHLDTASFQKELNKGLYFQSNIPQACGVGSSGAVVAAIYERYADKSVRKKQSLTELQQQLAVLESHFHGQSSGFDPLVVYLRQPLIKSPNGVEICHLTEKKSNSTVLFLVHTQQPRPKHPLVPIFLEKCKNEHFKKLITNDLVKINKICIDAFLNQNSDILWKQMRHLSVFQQKHFQPMIPLSIRQLWQYGLDSGAYYLKVCGSGGGGFMMGITQNWQQLQSIFPKNNLVKIQ